jgi:hypothetical protein
VANAQDLQFLDQAATSGVTDITEDQLAIALSPTLAVVQFPNRTWLITPRSTRSLRISPSPKGYRRRQPSPARPSILRSRPS